MKFASPIPRKMLRVLLRESSAIDHDDNKGRRVGTSSLPLIMRER